MISFDVESLFTNVPIESAVQAALRKQENDSDLATRTNLTPTQNADLLNYSNNYNGSINEQQDGAAMGSPVSVVIAAIYMEEFEEQAITNATCKPKIWKRYVDDTFSVLDRDDIYFQLLHLNIS